MGKISLFTHSKSLLREPGPAKPNVKIQAQSNWWNEFCACHLDNLTDVKELDLMCAKEQWANKPVQAKTLTFFGGKTLFYYSPSRQH